MSVGGSFLGRVRKIVQRALVVLGHQQGASTWLRRERFFKRARRFSPAMVAETDVGVFLVRTDDRALGQKLFVKQHRGELIFSALELLRAMDRWHPGGRMLLDVGANIGTTAVYALKQGEFDRVVAFEPDPANRALLRANAALNELDGAVQVLPYALSNRDGPVGFLRHPTKHSRHRVTEEVNESHERVEAATLDGLIERGEVDVADAALVKIDVEGHEGHVLAGAGRLLAAGVPVVVEFKPSSLRDSGGLGLLRESIVKHFSSVIDLRDELLLRDFLRPSLRGRRVRQALASEPSTFAPDRLDDLIVEMPHGRTDLLLIP